ncbi:hypothetical protein [Endozoicomonas ascidiicola]|uniref:hypothetical protein n=1 Tax=Endozoicomonas ascidiicola TaxID=1698521 RepID=UPI000A675AF6|nr:hypothetical protein [Endozoicomonas ascidiicola]
MNATDMTKQEAHETVLRLKKRRRINEQMAYQVFASRAGFETFEKYAQYMRLTKRWIA